MTLASSISRYELVPPPAPNTAARPATLGACQGRFAAFLFSCPIRGQNIFGAHIMRWVGVLRETKHAEVPRFFLRDRRGESRPPTINCSTRGGGGIPAVLAHQWLSQTAL